MLSYLAAPIRSSSQSLAELPDQTPRWRDRPTIQRSLLDVRRYLLPLQTSDTCMCVCNMCVYICIYIYIYTYIHIKSGCLWICCPLTISRKQDPRCVLLRPSALRSRVRGVAENEGRTDPSRSHTCAKCSETCITHGLKAVVVGFCLS